MSEELLPCPRCGTTNISFEFYTPSDGFRDGSGRMTCINGHAWDEWEDNEDAAILAWNTRPDSKPYKWDTYSQFRSARLHPEYFCPQEEAFKAARERKGEEEMSGNEINEKHGLTPVQMYGRLFRRGVRFDLARGFYLVKPERVGLGHDMITAYKATMHLPESSGGKD